jgi:hemerythrin
MSAFEWNESYSVKVGGMDHQHKKLFALVQELQDSMKAGHGKDKMGEVLARLVAYTVQHFGSEEALLQKQGYPELAEHQAEHKALTEKVLAFKKEYDAGVTSVVPLMNFLQNWLKDHILKVDQKYSEFMNAHGVR